MTQVSKPADPHALATGDIDPQETREWVDAILAVLRTDGPERARFLLRRVVDKALKAGVRGLDVTDYVNTIPVEAQPPFPGDEDMEIRIREILRWNAAMMVMRAGKKIPGIGGHIATYASISTLFEVGFNHFFRGKTGTDSGDQVFFQGHASPGIYARAWLEGRLTLDQLEHFRQEVERGRGLSSYPHPRLMPEFWEYPSVSMGLAPITSVAQARMNRYLMARGIKDTSSSRVWCFMGDGETDEPESLAALRLAAREGLDNLTFVVNCNLQRLDGPVRGNGKIIQELEAIFRAAGWNVIKVLWSSDWDPIFAKDRDGLLVERMNTIVDGDFQRFVADPAYKRQLLFGGDPRLEALVAGLSDKELRGLGRGGHDFKKVHAAYKAAVEHEGAPTVVLAQTIKGLGLSNMEARNTAHQAKSADIETLKLFRDRLNLPIPDRDLPELPWFDPGRDSDEVRYILERRKALGGFVPSRRRKSLVQVQHPSDEAFAEFRLGSKAGRKPVPVSTTMAFVKLLQNIIKDAEVGRRIVPIIPDEARTFGMEALFRTVGIFSPQGQKYLPVDKDKYLYYREHEAGQILQEGINEAGAISSFTAAGTSYSTHGEPLIPVYIFYSMFGFQRTGDQFWAFGDIRGRGFVMGATAGRTTLNGEGLQHQDGHSHLMASTIPCCISYDPAFAYEIAVIFREGLRRMFEEEEDVFYYITLQNENYLMPPMPEGCEEGIINGLYCFQRAEKRLDKHVHLFGSAVMVNQALEAARMLRERHGVSADVWSVTSYSELRRDALACERWNRLHPEAEPRVPYILRVLAGEEGPFVAVSDYMKILADQVARWIPGRYAVLGTDGFGLSDSRPALRRHFEVDAASVVIAALHALSEDGKIPAGDVTKALEELGYDPEKMDPTTL